MVPGPQVSGALLWARVEGRRDERELLSRKAITWGEVAAEMRVQQSALSRLSQGGTPSTHMLARVMLWLGVYDIREFVEACDDQ